MIVKAVLDLIQKHGGKVNDDGSIYFANLSQFTAASDDWVLYQQEKDQVRMTLSELSAKAKTHGERFILRSEHEAKIWQMCGLDNQSFEEAVTEVFGEGVDEYLMNKDDLMFLMLRLMPDLPVDILKSRIRQIPEAERNWKHNYFLNYDPANPGAGVPPGITPDGTNFPTIVDTYRASELGDDSISGGAVSEGDTNVNRGEG